MATTTNKPAPLAKRYTYTPRVYPVDERGFSPVDKALAKAYAREDMVKEDEEGSLNPYVLKVISAYPLDGTYPYHCGWTPREYDIYNGVTQDMWYKGHGGGQGVPGRLALQLLLRVHLRGVCPRHEDAQHPEGPGPGRFQRHDASATCSTCCSSGISRGRGIREQRGIVSYGLGREITDLEEVKPGDFLSYSTTPAGGHAVIFIEWMRDDQNKIVGFKYFSSNLSGSRGVGYGQGRFSDSNPNGRGILRKSLRIGRVGAIKDYKPFNRAEIPSSATRTRPRNRSASSTCRRQRRTPRPPSAIRRRHSPARSHLRAGSNISLHR